MNGRTRLEGVKLEGYRGTWYEIARMEVENIIYILLEHEQYGDETCWLVAALYPGSYDSYFLKVICETYDGLEVALEDECIL